jgi:hypothetical protein
VRGDAKRPFGRGSEAFSRRARAENAGDGAERIVAYTVRPVTFAASFEGGLSAAGRDVSAGIRSSTCRCLVGGIPRGAARPPAALDSAGIIRKVEPLAFFGAPEF